MGIPEAWGAGIVVGLLLLVLVLLGLFLAAPAAQWLARAPTTLRQLLEVLDHVRDAVWPHHRAPSVMRTDAIQDKLATEGLLFTRVVLGHVMQIMLSGAATIILLYFLLASQSWLVSRTVEVVPIVSGERPSDRQPIHKGWKSIHGIKWLRVTSTPFLNEVVSVQYSGAKAITVQTSKAP